MEQTFLLRLTAAQVASVGVCLSAESAPPECRDLGQRLKLYASPYPQGHCADCGAKIEGSGYVSPESAALTELVLEGFKAIESSQRVLCVECYRLAFVRVSGPGSIPPV